MKTRMLWSGLTAAAVMLAAGSALSDGTTHTRHATLADFDETTGELWAYPGTSQKLTSYLNDQSTQYLKADLAGFEPPDPCFLPSVAWNFTVAYDEAHHTRSTLVYNLLLGMLSRNACSARVTSIATGTPQPLVAFTPTK